MLDEGYSPRPKGDSEVKKVWNLFEKMEKVSVPIQKQDDWEEERKNLNERSKIIKDILRHYAEQQEERYKFKKNWKIFFIIFFLVLATAIIAGAFFLAIVAIKYFSDKQTELITCLITSGVSCFGSIVSILLIIIKYVFPNDEETNFNNLVANIVQNDTERLKDISNNDKK